MSIARAFTTRRARHTLDLKDGAPDGLPQRSRSTKGFLGGSIRNKISAPIKLTHTTNMLSYNAPDIFPQTAAVPSPSSSTRSDDDSDAASNAVSTPPTSPDTPNSSGPFSSTPEANHLSCYFMPPKQAGGAVATGAATSAPNAAATTGTDANYSAPASASAAFPASDAPVIPQRAPSHTKKSYDGLSRHRSMSRLSEHSTRSLSSKASFSFSRSSSTSTSTSVASAHSSTISHSAKPSFHLTQTATPSPVASAVSSPPVSHKREYSEVHPFGHELAKVSELVEEFGKEETLLEEPAAAPTAASASPAVIEEERELTRQGLHKFSAEDYISEIQGLMSSFFTDIRPMATVWI